MPLTITEALAEIKTIGKRVEKKRATILQFIARADGAKDPLEKDGGSEKFIASERQAVADLNAHVIALRRGIQHANDTTTVTIGEQSRTISEWLTWRREVAPGNKQFLDSLRAGIQNLRQQVQRQGNAVVPAGGVAEKPTDVMININEHKLAQEIESLEETLGVLDGQLSLKNATVTIKE